MAHPIEFKSDLETKSVENGATNSTAGVFKVYSLLKLALVFPYSVENGASNRSTVQSNWSWRSLSLKSNKILRSFKYIVRYSFGHKYAKFAFQQILNYYDVMFPNLIHWSTFFLQVVFSM